MLLNRQTHKGISEWPAASCPAVDPVSKCVSLSFLFSPLRDLSWQFFALCWVLLPFLISADKLRLLNRKIVFPGSFRG